MDLTESCLSWIFCQFDNSRNIRTASINQSIDESINTQMALLNNPNNCSSTLYKVLHHLYTAPGSKLHKVQHVTSTITHCFEMLWYRSMRKECEIVLKPNFLFTYMYDPMTHHSVLSKMALNQSKK